MKNTTTVWIDLDGTVADSTDRRIRAEHIAQTFAQGQGLGLYDEKTSDAYWKTFLDGKMLHLDTLLRGADETLLDLYRRGDTCIFVTSRPESMRVGTQRWLEEQLDVLYTRGRPHPLLLMKPVPTHAWTKSVTWKVGLIEALVCSMPPTQQRHLVVDDDPRICAELCKPDHPLAGRVTTFPSLAALHAHEFTQEEKEEDHPF